MRIRGRLIQATMERETHPMYELGRVNPITMPGRTRMRLEIEVDYHEGRFGGAGDIIEINTMRVSRAEVERPQNRELTSRATENIRQLARALEDAAMLPTLASATPAELDRIAQDAGVPRQPEPEPEPPKEKTRWNLLEID